MQRSQRIFAFCLALAGVSFGARASDLPPAQPTPSFFSPASFLNGSDWIVTFSGQVSEGPTYPGARKYSFFGLPGIGLRQADSVEHFSTPDDGFNIPVYENDYLRFGPVGRLVGDRATYGDKSLSGMAYIPPSLELGGFTEFTPLSWMRARLELRQAVTGHDGLAATVGGDVWNRWGDVTLSVGPRVNFGNDKYAQTYFGVAPAQSVANLAAGGNLTPYNAQGGMISAGLTTAARYDMNRDWRFTLFGNYQRISGNVAGSPIVEHAGSRDQYVGGLELDDSAADAGWRPPANSSNL